MKRILLIAALAAMFAGCRSDESEYIGRGRVLMDTEGCVFIAHTQGSESVYLNLAREHSQRQCPLMARAAAVEKDQ